MFVNIGLYAATLGLFLGSFINVLVWRTYKKMNYTSERSICPHCRHVLGLLDLIPVVSWVMLKGRCRYCKRHISIQYPIVELLTAILFGLIAWQIEPSDLFSVLHASFWWLATIFLVALAVYDVRWQLLPNKFVFLLIILAFTFRMVEFMLTGDSPRFVEAVVGGTLLFSLFASIFYLSQGEWLGGGDVKLAVFIGSALGWQLGLLSITIAAWTGVIFIVITSLIQKRKPRAHTRLSFGPLLILGTYCALFWGKSIIEWYISVFI